MSHADFADRLNSRSNLYQDGRILDPRFSIALRVSAEFACEFDTQVSLVTAASLLSRMTPNLVIDVPKVPLHSHIPWKSATLGEFIETNVCLDRPDQETQFRPVDVEDYVLNLGPRGGPVNVHGSGWFAFVGSSPSNVPVSDSLNPIGPALASIVAVSRLFDRKPKPIESDVILDAFEWRSVIDEFPDYPYQPHTTLGNLWCIGVGSVGTAALFFLTLGTRYFDAALIDMDQVKIENLDRSPIFRAEHADKNLDKVEATELFLRSAGVESVIRDNSSFAQSKIRKDRHHNPDVLISAANENNVRHSIEISMPPIQVYATTGNSWQTTLFRHIPYRDACSCCVFPPTLQIADTVCASGQIDDEETGEQIDAALPFLSYIAGLMTAAEIFKLASPGYPFSKHNKITFRAPSPKKKEPDFFRQLFEQQESCLCQSRDREIHQNLIATTKYAALSELKDPV